MLNVASGCARSSVISMESSLQMPVSTVNHGHRRSAVPLARNLIWCKGIVQGLHVRGAERDCCGVDVLFEIASALRARDRHH
jgi:hypothetical protein